RVHSPSLHDALPIFEDTITSAHEAVTLLQKERDHWETACKGRAEEHRKHLDDKLNLKKEMASLRAQFLASETHRQKLVEALKARSEEHTSELQSREK